jgi:hypothetical protein
VAELVEDYGIDQMIGPPLDSSDDDGGAPNDACLLPTPSGSLTRKRKSSNAVINSVPKRQCEATAGVAAEEAQVPAEEEKNE